MAVSALRLVLADHDASPRTALRRTLDGEPSVVVVGSCSSPLAVLPLLARCAPDVFLLDLGFPGGEAWDMLSQLGAHGTAVPIVAVCDHADDAILLRALRLGARAVLEKQAPPLLFIECLHAIATHRHWVTPEQLDTLIASMRTRSTTPESAKRPATRGGRPFGLTRRELDIVAGIADGQSNREIAERLSVKECTVKHHVSSVFDKLGVFSRLELALFALHHQLVSISDLVH